MTKAFWRVAVLFLCQTAAYSAPMFVAPTLLSISPANGNPGQIANVIIQGADFSQGATVAISGTGVTVNVSQVVSSTSLLATFFIAANATAGSRDVTVTTSGGASTAIAFTVNAAATPTLTATSVPNANLGQTVNITLT